MRIKYNRKVLRYRLVTHDIKHISLMPFLLLNLSVGGLRNENKTTTETTCTKLFGTKI